MASGMEMMLKSMGFDKEKIESDFANMKDEVNTFANNLREQLNRIEASQNHIMNTNALILLKLDKLTSSQVPAGDDGLLSLYVGNGPDESGSFDIAPNGRL